MSRISIRHARRLTGKSPPCDYIGVREIELAWAAGFVDGEGCFTAWKRKKDRGYGLIFSTNQVDPRPLQRLVDALGMGTVSGPFSPPSHKGRPFYTVRLYQKNTWKMVELLWPYLSEPKKEQINRVVDKVNAAR